MCWPPKKWDCIGRSLFAHWFCLPGFQCLPFGCARHFVSVSNPGEATGYIMDLASMKKYGDRAPTKQYIYIYIYIQRNTHIKQWKLLSPIQYVCMYGAWPYLLHQGCSCKSIKYTQLNYTVTCLGLATLKSLSKWCTRPTCPASDRTTSLHACMCVCTYNISYCSSWPRFFKDRTNCRSSSLWLVHSEIFSMACNSAP